MLAFGVDADAAHDMLRSTSREGGLAVAEISEGLVSRLPELGLRREDRAGVRSLLALVLLTARPSTGH
jgi:hypothetical protein